jgi:Family of unknown function (DUF5682)
MTVTIFGIRHHGPGSARSLVRSLQQFQPDIVLVEGPPDANEILPLVTHPDMKPPVALLVYVPDDGTTSSSRLDHSVYYPFAEFSPEWQAIRYGLMRHIPVRFADLPQAYRLCGGEETQDKMTNIPVSPLRRDPLGELAAAAGYGDGERWWEQMVEQRWDCRDLFEGILEAMTALRQVLEVEAGEGEIDCLDTRREASMRQSIRQAEKDGFDRIGVVCGAWHAPALTQMPSAAKDQAILAGLSKTSVKATWIPWTYGRLAVGSGYSAGVASPGWYHYLWEHSELDLLPNGNGEEERGHRGESRMTIGWMTRVAQLLREEGFEASSAQTIEAVRLAEALAALRDRPLPGLPELNEATQAVMCFGSDVPMRLIDHKLIVGDCLGSVPASTPKVPLDADIQRWQKRLRLKPEPTEKLMTLDLRKSKDLDRSYLLHRLNLLGIPWGKRQQVRGMGTFKETWNLRWKPEFAVTILEAAPWGNTVLAAATAYTCHLAETISVLPDLTALLDRVLLAEVSGTIAPLMEKIDTITALTSDVEHLMDALPPLAQILRYGNVRQTETSLVSHVVDGLVARSCIGFPQACHFVNDEVAANLFQRMLEFDRAVSLLQNPQHLESWQEALLQLAENSGINGLLAGGSCRLLLDKRCFDSAEASRRMGLALSLASEPLGAAAWVEGFLQGSGLILLHDDRLFGAIDIWVKSINDETFTAILPLLRRTFSTFPPAERRQLGEKIRRGSVPSAKSGEMDFGRVDFERVDFVLPIVAQLLGLENTQIFD